MAAIATQGEGASQAWTLRNACLEVVFKREHLDLTVVDTRSGKRWAMEPEGSTGFLIQKAGIQFPKPLCDLELHRSREVREGAFHGVELMSVPKDPWQVYDIRVRVLIHDTEPEVAVSVRPHEQPGYTADTWVREVHYPRSFSHSQSGTAYTVIPFQQGTLLPGDWQMDLTGEDMLGLISPWNWESCTGPWWGHVDDGGSAYLAIMDTPDDAAFDFAHPSGGPTRMAPRWLTSYEAFRYTRRMRYRFLDKGDYTDVAFAYRDYCKAIGRWRSVEEKRLEKPQMDKHLGAIGMREMALLTTLRWSGVSRRFQTFDQIAEKLEKLIRNNPGDNVYFTLAGWQTLGYDHAHPQACPPNAEAGGWDGMRRIFDLAEKADVLRGVHEQYRDFFYSSPYFSEDLTRKDSRRDSPRHQYWAGATQSILCPSLMLDFVKMNVQQLIDQHIHLNATYQDVLTAIPLEECYDARHPVNRTQCREARASIADYYGELGWLITSESASDWAIPVLDSIRVHHPRLKPHEPFTSPLVGIPVPLFSLVFHDAALLVSKATPTMIAALGGVNTYQADDRLLRRLHRTIGYMPMTAHRLLSDDGMEQEAVFGDAVTVHGHIENGTYRITGLDKKEISRTLKDGRM
ncbi:MAG: hypothetical protein GF331_08225 [Chitinivibrionales bacterium]|nr:hypothetical protein [Chitinivibrionales bacterium]